MTVGIFQSHDVGLAALLGAGNWITDNHYAILVKSGQTVVPAGAIQSDIIGNVCDDAGYGHIDLTGEAINIRVTRVRFDCAKINFGATVTLSGRYVYILNGTAAGSGAGDVVIGCIDLRTENDGDVSSVAAEFSYDPAATEGLFEIGRTA